MRFRGAPVQLERTTLTQVIARAGAGVIGHGGGEDADVRQLCYATGRGPRAGFIIFESSEMGGDEGAITGITMGSGPPPRRCTPLLGASPALEHGIRVGMTEAALQAIMRRRGRTPTAGALTFEGEYPCSAPDDPHDPPPSPDCSTYAGVQATLKNHRVARLHIWQVSST